LALLSQMSDMMATCCYVMLVNLYETKQHQICCLVTSMRISNVCHKGIITTRERKLCPFMGTVETYLLYWEQMWYVQFPREGIC